MESLKSIGFIGQEWKNQSSSQLLKSNSIVTFGYQAQWVSAASTWQRQSVITRASRTQLLLVSGPECWGRLLALFVNEQLRVTDDVDEQDMSDLELDI
jgi:hypothetical protein